MSSTRTTLQRPPVTGTARPGATIPPPGTPLFEDQIRGYRNRQRQLYNLERGTRNIARRLTEGRAYQRTLEQQVDPDVQLQLSMTERANLVPAEVLYRSRSDNVNHRLYIHRSEEVLLVTDGM